MQTYKLKVYRREKLGKEHAKKLRKQGFVTAEAYGKGEENLHLYLRKYDIDKILRETHGETVIIQLELNGDSKLAFIQEVQRNIVNGDIIHVDFHIVHKGEKVEVVVPIHVVGQESSPGLKKGGVVDIHMHELKVWAKPYDVPGSIEVDISNLDLGDVIYVKDLAKMYPNIEFEEEEDEVILSIVSPTGEETKEETETSEEEGTTEEA